MPKENDNPVVWRYFKNGDIVRDSEDSIWGKKLFEIYYFHGNSYLPLVSAHFVGKPKTNGNMCNFDLRELKLITAKNRPFKKLKKTALLKLMKKGNVEAKREMIMRINSKKF